MSGPLTLEQATKLCWNTAQMTRLVGLPGPQLARWLDEGVLKVSHNPKAPEPRRFSFRDLFHLTVFMDMQRMVLLAKHCIGQATFMPGFNAEPPGVLVVWHGPMKPGGAYDIANPVLHGRVFKLSELADVMNDPDKRTMVAINLAQVEARLLLALSKIEGKPIEPGPDTPAPPPAELDTDDVYARFNKAIGASFV